MPARSRRGGRPARSAATAPRCHRATRGAPGTRSSWFAPALGHSRTRTKLSTSTLCPADHATSHPRAMLKFSRAIVQVRSIPDPRRLGYQRSPGVIGTSKRWSSIVKTNPHGSSLQGMPMSSLSRTPTWRVPSLNTPQSHDVVSLVDPSAVLLSVDASGVSPSTSPVPPSAMGRLPSRSPPSSVAASVVVSDAPPPAAGPHP